MQQATIHGKGLPACRIFWRQPRNVAAAFSGILAAIAMLPAAMAAEPLKICILSGCDTYHSEKSLPPFQQWLEKHYNVQCTRLVKKSQDDLPGLQQLEDCDVAFVFFKRMSLRGEQLERFQKYVLSGRPIVAVRTASHAVQTWLEFDREVLGGNYQGHYDQQPPTAISIVEGKADHPILKGFTLTQAPGPLYKNSSHAADIELLLTGKSGDAVEPLAWTREYKGGRVFYTSLGNVETFEEEAFRQMLARALFWTARREPQRKDADNP